jgi:putative heme-binding domain-containing protein
MDALIAELLPAIERPGDVANGKELFTKNCANCHSFDGLDDGVGAHVGPELTGMGAHGREHLLPFIVDPNRSVEAAYLEYVAETVDGKLVAGVLTYDGPSSITLSSSEGENEVRRDEIETLRSTGRTPMPTGFEDLGTDALRDILAFLCAGYEDYRIVGIEQLCTASTSEGLYDRRRDDKPIRFVDFGVVDVLGVPMELLDPARMSQANNALVLKGGSVADWGSKLNMPESVRVPVGFALQRMHVLGGVSAWGFPSRSTNEPVVSWTWHYADGTDENVVLHDGVEFADWIRRHDVPGSSFVEGMIEDGSWGQVRAFHVDPSRTDVAVTSITLASFDNHMAPTFLGLTAQVRGVSADDTPADAPPVTGPEVLVVGGGSSHDFERWYRGELLTSLDVDRALEYTSSIPDVLPRLARLDLLVLANNQPLPGQELRGAVFDVVERGAGLLIVHPAAWYNWADWPEYNARLVGGGARSHEAYGTFDVRVDRPDHPAMANVPATFEVADELYRFESAQDGSSIEVLATGTSRTTGASYPVVWTVDAGAGRVVCVTLGHDGGAHNDPAFRTLMASAAAWLAP